MTDAVPEVPGRTLRLLVAYHGPSFHGFAPNDGVVTVAGSLEQALSRALRCPTTVVGAGRTDAGVHAWGQVVSCVVPASTDLEHVRRRINAQTAPQLVVRQVQWAPDGFHARFSAQWRRYRYTIINGPSPDPFRHDTTWHIERPLSLPTMRLAGDALIGTHDFSSFCRRPKGDPEATLRRRVLDLGWTRVERGGADGVELVCVMTGTAFCHQMVRSIVGSLVEVGLGRRRPSDVGEMLRARDRRTTGPVAPPQGLCLWEVGYAADPDGSLPFGS